MHALQSKVATVRLASVVLRHRHRLPTEDRHELVNGGAICSCCDRGNFTYPVRRFNHACLTRRCAEHVAETFLSQRLAVLTNYEVEIARWPRVYRFLKHVQNRDRYFKLFTDRPPLSGPVGMLV